jgi:hypothetical protein
MPLWAAGLLLILCVPLSVLSLRHYRTARAAGLSGAGGKFFLAGGIFLLLVLIIAVVYIAATVLLVSGIK